MKLPFTVTVVPSSVIIPFANWLLALSHLIILLSIRLVPFLIEYSVPFVSVSPSPALSEEPVSVLTELISIVVTQPALV